MHANTSRCSRQNYITGFQCNWSATKQTKLPTHFHQKWQDNSSNINSLRQQMNDIVDSVNEFTCVASLFLNSVDAACDFEIMWIWYQTFVNNCWSQRTKRIHWFSNQELATVSAFLPIACRYILGNAVPKYVVQCIRLADLSSFFPDYYG